MPTPPITPKPAALDWGRKPIRLQLALLVLVLLLPAFGAAIWFLVEERNEARRAARDKVKLLVDSTADRIAANLRGHEALLEQIASQPLVRAMDAGTCDPLIDSMVRLHPEYLTIGTRDLQGNPVCTYRAEAPDARAMQAFQWFRDGLEIDAFRVGEAFMAPLARRWVAALTYPVRDAAGRRNGMVVLPLDLQKLGRTIMGAVPATAVVTVSDGQSNIVMRSTDAQQWIGQPVPAAIAEETRGEGFATRAGADGVRRLVAFKHLPDIGWRVSAGVSEQAVFAAADRALRNGVLACVVFLLAALALAWRMALGIVRPLDSLANLAARVTHGDTAARAASDTGPPELLAVAQSFNRMLDARAIAEAALRENEQNLAITLQSIGDAVIATDPQGRVTRMNSVAEQLTGWPLAEALGQPLSAVFRIVNASTREESLDPVQRVLDSGQVVGLANHTTLLVRGGAERQISDSAAPIRDVAGRIVGVVLVFSDVSEQYRLQRVLQDSEHRYRALVEASPIGVYVHRDNRYLYVNPAAVRLFGAPSAGVLMEHPVLERIHPDYRALVVERMRVNLETQRATASHEEIFLRLDGSPMDVEIQAAPVVYQGGTALQVCFLDITDRKRAEQALRRSEENLAITLQSIGDAVMATDVQGCVTRMNPVAERLTGWPFAQASGRPLSEVFRIVDAHTRAAATDPVQRVLASGRVVELANHTALLARDGMEYQIADSAAPIRDAQGQVRGVVLVFSDVTERYRLQRAVQESEHRYRGLVESSPVGVAMHRDGLVLYANPTAVRLLGAPSAQALVGRSVLDFIHPDYHAMLRQRVREVRDGMPMLPMTEWQYVRLDGGVIDVQAQATMVTIQGQSTVQVSFLDITARKQAERTLRDNEARFRALTHLSSDWYWEQDEHFRFVRMDGDLQGITGRPIEEHIGRTRWELEERSLSEADWEQHRALLRSHQEFRDFQMRQRGHRGREMWVSVSGTPIFDAQGAFRGYRGIGRDITAQKEAADQIHALAFYDALTELPNRRLLIEQLKKALVTHARTHRQAALLFIDLDNFKTLNDTLGHETGDLLLRQVAQRLLSCVREADSVARLGGDEFVVMLEDLSEDLAEAVEQAEQVGHKILNACAAPFNLAEREYRSTPSIGITLFGKTPQSVEDLLKQADLAMYQAKAAGRNTLRLFDRRMQAAVDGRAAIEAELRTGLAADHMLLHFQPVVQVDGSVTGAEALVRWRHPERGLVAPGEFIAVAEATRLILPLGRWVMASACAQLATWSARPETSHLTLAVNVSAHQFVEPDFVLDVVRALESHGADPRRLKLELTESLLADNMDDIVLKMEALRAVGVDFSLDDFGTGYSSLSYLKRLPLTQLKIDQSFVRDVLVDPSDAAIARTIVALGASLGMAVIAEGVETEGQYRFLVDIGCHAFQGYLFGRPVCIAEFDEGLRLRRFAPPRNSG